MADILDEVEDDYRAAQIGAAARRYAWIGVAVVAAALLTGAGWQYGQTRQRQGALAQSAAYEQANKDTASGGDAAAQAAARLADLAATAPAGYRTLERLRAAALLADAGRLPAAQSIWDQVGSDPACDPLLRQLAALLWVQRGIDAADPAALRTRLVSLIGQDSVFKAQGQELQALLDLRLRQPEAARAVLRRLAGDPSVPDGPRGRADALLSRLGG